jgi:hypothetical protein
MKKRSKEEILVIQERATVLAIDWAKSDMTSLSDDVADTMEEYMDSMYCNSANSINVIRDHRKKACEVIVIDCIYALTREQLDKLDRALKILADSVD